MALTLIHHLVWHSSRFIAYYGTHIIHRLWWRHSSPLSTNYVRPDSSQLKIRRQLLHRARSSPSPLLSSYMTSLALSTGAKMLCLFLCQVSTQTWQRGAAVDTAFLPNNKTRTHDSRVARLVQIGSKMREPLHFQDIIKKNPKKKRKQKILKKLDWTSLYWTQFVKSFTLLSLH